MLRSLGERMPNDVIDICIEATPKRWDIGVATLSIALARCQRRTSAPQRSSYATMASEQISAARPTAEALVRCSGGLVQTLTHSYRLDAGGGDLPGRFRILALRSELARVLRRAIPEPVPLPTT